MQNSNFKNTDANIILLRKFILNHIEKERQLTQNKINLLLKYSANQIFKFFCPKNEFISDNSFKNIFNTLDINSIKKIIEIYDKDKDSFLNFQEFYNFIYPKYIDNNIDKLRKNNLKGIIHEEIDNEAKNCLYNILQIEIKNLNDSTELIKKIIDNIKTYNNLNIYLYLFQLIKGNDDNYDYLNEYIYSKDIIKFLENNKTGIKVYEQDIDNFIFRYDFSNNLKLNIEEFTNMINYFFEYENNNKNGLNIKNIYNEFLSRNPLFYDYSTYDINNSTNNEKNNINDNNSIKNNNSLSNQENYDENNIITNNKTNIDINSAINFKEKELRNLKINSLAEYFKLIIKELDELEINKIHLYQLINPNELFSFFDIKKEYYINKDNFISIFNKHFNIQIKEEDFLYLIKKYDFDKDDKLNYEEFNHMISPISIINQKIEEKNFENNLCTVKIYNKEQENSIKDLFIKLINCEKSIEKQKQKLSEIPFYSHYEMFEFIRNKKSKLLNSEDVFYFLKNNNVIIQNEQFDLLLNYLFFSIEKNKEYNFIDFVKILNIF